MDIPEIVKVGCAVVVLGYHIYRLPKHTTKEMRRAQSFALYCCSALFIAMLINNYAINFFEYSPYMLLATFIPTVIYVAYFVYGKKIHKQLKRDK